MSLPDLHVTEPIRVQCVGLASNDRNIEEMIEKQFPWEKSMVPGMNPVLWLVIPSPSPSVCRRCVETLHSVPGANESLVIDVVRDVDIHVLGLLPVHTDTTIVDQFRARVCDSLTEGSGYACESAVVAMDPMDWPTVAWDRIWTPAMNGNHMWIQCLIPWNETTTTLSAPLLQRRDTSTRLIALRAALSVVYPQQSMEENALLRLIVVLEAHWHLDLIPVNGLTNVASELPMETVLWAVWWVLPRLAPLDASPSQSIIAIMTIAALNMCTALTKQRK